MNGTIYYDSDEVIRTRQEKRMHVLWRAPNACAVHLVFADHSVVVKHETLASSIRAATEMAHTLMRNHDLSSSQSSYMLDATLRPITAEQMRELNDGGVELIDSVQAKAVLNLCVATCYEVIRDCPDSAVRLEAAKLLRAIGYSERGAL